MKKWATTLILNIGGTKVKVEDIGIKRGIFQGDSLSPVWFCLALNPLSNILNKMKCGYKIEEEQRAGYCLSHLLYMDDIKLYAKNQKEIDSLMRITHDYSRYIGMNFGVDKCRTVTIHRGQYQEKSITLPVDGSENGLIIEALQRGEMYKYLGMEQARRTENAVIKERLKTEYRKRIQAICKTRLNGRNMVKAVNTLAIPVLTYSFGIIPWSNTELEEVKRMMRTSFTKFKYHHPKATIERITIPRKEGGRGVIDLRKCTLGRSST